MDLCDLDFSFPERLIAQQPEHPPRVMLVDQGIPEEIAFSDVLKRIPAGDLLVINNTQVVKHRVFALSGEEILFLRPQNRVVMETSGANFGKLVSAHSMQDLAQGLAAATIWQVLFPARKLQVGDVLTLPGERQVKLLAKGRPQLVEVDGPLDEAYFEKYGELPLPPYIQTARQERHNRVQDRQWYQTAWASQHGSMASPTASLHFDEKDLTALRARGVEVAEVTLHVGLGTFLPVRVERLEDHQMHSEEACVPRVTVEALRRTRQQGRKVWALGTTVVRTLEAFARNHLRELISGDVMGETSLLLKPGDDFLLVDRLLTNFHQPRSTLLALVAAFAGLEAVHNAYDWAIERNFRLFSYGDLTLWIPNRK